MLAGGDGPWTRPAGECAPGIVRVSEATLAMMMMRRYKAALRPGGVICVKENTILRGSFVVDKEDNSITRTAAQYKGIFSRAGLELVAEMRQPFWPSNLFPAGRKKTPRSDHSTPPVAATSREGERGPWRRLGERLGAAAVWMGVESVAPQAPPSRSRGPPRLASSHFASRQKVSR